MSQAAAITEVPVFSCRVITPRRTVYAGTVRRLVVEGAGGSFEVMTRHEPIMTPLAIGELILQPVEGDEDRFAIHGGFLDMNSEEALILADAAENAKEIDVERAKASMARAKERLAEIARKAEGKVIDADRAKLALMRALQRLRLRDPGLSTSDK